MNKYYKTDYHTVLKLLWIFKLNKRKHILLFENRKLGSRILSSKCTTCPYLPLCKRKTHLVCYSLSYFKKLIKYKVFTKSDKITFILTTKEK